MRSLPPKHALRPLLDGVSSHRSAHRLSSAKPLEFTAAGAPSPRELAEAAKEREASRRIRPTWRTKFVESWRAGNDMDSMLSIPRQKKAPFADGLATAIQYDEQGNLNIKTPYVSRHLMRERATKSLDEVLPQVESLMAHGFRPTEYTLSALIGRDVSHVHIMLDVSQLLRVEPNAVVWSQLMNNALHARGPLSAMDVYKAAPQVNTSAIQNVSNALLNRTAFYRPDAHALSTVRDMYHRKFSDPNTEDDSRYELLNLISSLRGSHAVKNAQEDAVFFLDQLVRSGNELHENPVVGRAIDAIYRVDSFDAAVDAVWNVESIGGTKYGDMLGLLARICALRFHQRSTIPLSSVDRFEEKIRAAGDELDARPLVIALKSYSVAGVQLAISEEANALGTARDEHVALALTDTVAIEDRVRKDKQDVRIVTLLARAYSTLGAFDDALRLWREYPGKPSAQLLQVMISGCRRYERLELARSLLVEAQERGCMLDARILASWAEALADLGAPEEAVSTFERFCNDRGPMSEITASAVRILRWVSGARAGGPRLRERMFAATPETWSQPRILEDYDINFDQRRRRSTQKLLQNVSKVVWSKHAARPST